MIFDDLESAGIFLSKKTTYADIIQRLVRRYLFKLDREKAENEKGRRLNIVLTHISTGDNIAMWSVISIN